MMPLEEGPAAIRRVTSESQVVDSTTTWLKLSECLTVNNRQRFGDVKQVEFAGSISVIGALKAAQGRVDDVIDVTPTDDNQQIE